MIGAGLIVGPALFVPNLLQLFKPKTRQDKNKYKKTIEKMFNDKIIYLSGDEVRLSDDGLKLLKISQIDDITSVKKDSQWDQTWRLVCYDVPEKYKTARDCFRRKLIELGFEQVQYSLWVNPWECREEIAIIAQNLGIAPYVAYLYTNHLPKQEHLLDHFDLTELE